ncbi:uncharacterized protein LOC106510389 [Sus scrofa]|uniref:uncharacterized protein LOC106510389 n=1 Tax=Sus scrofa TaxID=9823 RepID=UPI000A2AF02A|nr:uncharacterized protein LOC106510389 [Sus scrofa]
MRTRSGRRAGKRGATATPSPFLSAGRDRLFAPERYTSRANLFSSDETRPRAPQASQFDGAGCLAQHRGLSLQTCSPPTAKAPGTQLALAFFPALKKPPQTCRSPGWPSCQRRWIYFKCCTHCPRSEDTGMGPATRITPSGHEPELTRSQIPQPGLGLPPSGRRPGYRGGRLSQGKHLEIQEPRESRARERGCPTRQPPPALPTPAPPE